MQEKNPSQLYQSINLEWQLGQTLYPKQAQLEENIVTCKDLNQQRYSLVIYIANWVEKENTNSKLFSLRL